LEEGLYRVGNGEGVKLFLKDLLAVVEVAMGVAEDEIGGKF
jgi:hypothetical protein